MKSFIKKNKLLLIILILFLIILIADIVVFGIKQYQSAKEFEKLVGNFIIPKYDVPYMWHEFRKNGIISMFSFIYPLMAIIPGIWIFNSSIKKGKNNIIKLSYKKYLKKEILNSWKSALIFPTCLVLTFIAILIITGFYFPVQNGNIISISGEQISIFTFVIELICTILFFGVISIAFINVGLIYSRKCSNFVITIISSYFTIIVYNLIVEIIIGPILGSLTNNYFFHNGLSVLSLELYDTGINHLNLLTYSLFLMIITTVFLFLTHKKEKKY